MSVVTFAEARHIVEQQAGGLQPTNVETVPLLAARDRVLAEAVLADRDFPPFARSIRDGYAVRARDVAQPPVRLQVVGEIKAGSVPESITCGLEPGQAVEIMTGAPLPAGADAVVMLEYSAREGDTVVLSQGAGPGLNVVPRGAEASAGCLLLAPGTRMEPATIGLAASAGKSQLAVHVKPRVAVLVTGDELVEITSVPEPYQIRNSNSYSLAAQVEAAGAHALVLPVARDEVDGLRRAITQGLAADLLLITGGVSMGKYDLVEQVLAELQAEFLFTGALIQPGKPVVFGHVLSPASGCARKFFFGLPGNPVSAMVTFDLFVRPLISALSGGTLRPLVFLQANLKTEFRIKPGLTRFLPAALSGEFERAEVAPIPWQGSGDMAAAARANCYLVVPPDRERIAPGEKVSVLIKS
jgi:molybdopterin molybdotransferase